MQSASSINNTRKLVLYNQILDSKLEPNSKFCSKLVITSGAHCNPWIERLNIFAKHPINKRILPIFYRPDICTRLEDVGHPTAGIPELDEKDFNLSKVFNLSTDPQKLVKDRESARILLKKYNRGGHLSSSIRNDWLVSRQRYWGTPIPIIHCSKCGAIPVPENQLPVKLPKLTKPIARNSRPLLEALNWKNTNCPKCDGPAVRDTDTLDTFVDSSWYFLRYLDNKNAHELCSFERAKKLIPVDIYVGGLEHATKHLYYARFITHFLNDLGISPVREPFRRFIPVGVVMGETYRDSRTGKYFVPSEIESFLTDGIKSFRVKSSGEIVDLFWDKMSKSKHNGVDPSDVSNRLGIDLTRLCMLSNTGPHKERKWEEDEILLGVRKWLQKISKLLDEFENYLTHSSRQKQSIKISQSSIEQLKKAHKRAIKQVTGFYSESFIISSVIAQLQTLTQVLRKFASEHCLEIQLSSAAVELFEFNAALADLIIMLHPICPLLSCEFWERLKKSWLLLQKDNSDETLHILFEKISGCYKIDGHVFEQRFPKNESLMCK